MHESHMLYLELIKLDAEQYCLNRLHKLLKEQNRF